MVHPAFKICISMGADWRTQLTTHADEAHLIELRIDLMFHNGETLLQMTETIAPLLQKYSPKIVLTCRLGSISQEDRRDLFLSLLSLAPPACFDLEYDTPHSYSTPLYNAVQQTATQIIASYHNFIATPNTPHLCAIADSALMQGADFIKIVTQCHNQQDEERLLSLYKEPRYVHKMIAFSVGQYALSSRIKSLSLGAPIMYVAPDDGSSTAPGQPCYSQLFPCQL